MRIKSIKRINYIKSCIIEGYKGYFSEWEIQIESGAAYGFILDFCKKYLSEQKFTKKQFIEGLEYFAEQVVLQKNSIKIVIKIFTFISIIK
jgi:hypothetical protein